MIHAVLGVKILNVKSKMESVMPESTAIVIPWSDPAKSKGKQIVKNTSIQMWNRIKCRQGIMRESVNIKPKPMMTESIRVSIIFIGLQLVRKARQISVCFVRRLQGCNEYICLVSAQCWRASD